jgi:hypothetical protein
MSKKTIVTTNGKRGGNLVGKPHKDKQGNDVGGVKAVVTDANNRPVELEGGEVIINKEASKKYWKELSRINQSAGGGVPIDKPIDPHDEDPEEYAKGGKIQFNPNQLPNKWILKYAQHIKKNYPEIWKKGGNIYGNQAFLNLERVAERGYWLDSEEWFYIKWRSFVARHKGDFRIAGVVAMLKWVDKVDRGWQYMKNLIEDEIKKLEAKKSTKAKGGWSVSEEERMSKGGTTERQQAKIGYTMREFQEGKLKTSYGKKVTDEKQALAISLSKAGIEKKEYGGMIEIGLKGFYNGKQRVPITVTKVNNKNIYFRNEETGEIKRSERKNFERLFDSTSSIDSNVSKPPTSANYDFDNVDDGNVSSGGSQTSDIDEKIEKLRKKIDAFQAIINNPKSEKQRNFAKGKMKEAREELEKLLAQKHGSVQNYVHDQLNKKSDDSTPKRRKKDSSKDDSAKVDYYAMFKQNNEVIEMSENETLAIQLGRFVAMVDEDRLMKMENVQDLRSAIDKLG